VTAARRKHSPIGLVLPKDGHAVPIQVPYPGA
jgi:hypothetical protein